MVLQWTLGCMYLFELWFSPDTCLGAGLLGHTVILGFPGCASGKEHTCKYRRQRDMGSTLGSGRSGGGHDNPFQYSCLENPMDRGAWWATVHRVAKSRTWLKWLSTHTCNWYDWGDLEINLAQSSTLQLGPRRGSSVLRIQCEFGSQLGSPQMHNFPFLQPRHYE